MAGLLDEYCLELKKEDGTLLESVYFQMLTYEGAVRKARKTARILFEAGTRAFIEVAIARLTPRYKRDQTLIGWKLRRTVDIRVFRGR